MVKFPQNKHCYYDHINKEWEAGKAGWADLAGKVGRAGRQGEMSQAGQAGKMVWTITRSWLG